MKVSQFTYSLPKSSIAQSPADPRDSSKLLLLKKYTGSIDHKTFRDLTDLLTPNDVLVFNNTKVFPARLFGKKTSGGKVELLLLENISDFEWTAIGKNMPSIGEKIKFANFSAEVINKDEVSKVKFSLLKDDLLTELKKVGRTPIPPYIHTNSTEDKLRNEYQTVYAKNTGSVAAPTAGLHFTPMLIDEIKDKGVQIEEITLHVGIGTFLPIKSNDVKQHKMHAEVYEISKDTADRLKKAQKKGKRIIAVGTTTTRALESFAQTGKLTGTTNLFIYPAYKFKYVDAMITNFHLPKSTLLAMISAFVSYPNASTKFASFKESVVGKAYKEAIKNGYRFYSFGDAMFIS